MKKIFLYTVVFILVTMPSSTWAQRPSEADIYEVVDNQYGLKLIIPNTKNWDVKIENAQSSHLMIRNESKDCQIHINEYISSMKTPQEAHDKEASFIQKISPDTQFFNKDQKLLLGKTADAVSMTFKYANSDEVKRKVFYGYKGKLYEILFQFKENKYSECKDDFSSIFKNMSFIEPNSDGPTVKYMRGVGLKAPSQQWAIATYKYGMFMDYTNPTTRKYEVILYLVATGHPITSLQAAYDAHIKELKTSNPKTQFKIENERFKLHGNIDAMSVTYIDPIKKAVKRDIVFLHRGTATELNFSVLEEAWATHKPELKNILNNNVFVF